MLSLLSSRFRRLALALLPLLAAGSLTAQSLLKSYPLQGDVRTTYWTFLASPNPYRIPDSPATMTGTMTVASPGYGAGMGLYSWTGNYSMAVNQSSTAAPSFPIRQAVFQLDLTWDPATAFPFNGGPTLSYNGGSQRLPATLPMILDGTRVVENETGVPEMEGIDSFSYRGVTWQWDLSAVPGTITSVKIEMPFANHTSVVGARIDVASAFHELGSDLSPLEQWRMTHFQTAENSGSAADGADRDGDGIPNLVEYGLGTSPVLAGGADGPAAKPQPLLPDGRLALSFSLPATVPQGLTYRVRVSSDLAEWKTLASKTGAAAWTWSGENESRITATAAGGRSLVTVEDDSPGDARRMMRLEVSHAD